jgi:hypothetical protein
LRKATTSFVMSVCLSICSYGKTWLFIFMKFDIRVLFWKYFEGNLSLKYDKNSRYFTWRPMRIYVNISLNSTRNEKCCRRKL